MRHLSRVSVARLTLALIAALALTASLHTNTASAKLKKETKKIAKAVFKNIVLRKLTTQRKIMPLPVPVPVPIELNSPPVYLNGPPKYVTVYKTVAPSTPPPPPPPPIIKPIIHKSYISYNVPPTNDEYSKEKYAFKRDLYELAQATAAGKYAAESANAAAEQLESSRAVDEADAALSLWPRKLHRHKFNDFDDDVDVSSNYYARRRSSDDQPAAMHTSIDDEEAYADWQASSVDSRSEPREQRNDAHASNSNSNYDDDDEDDDDLDSAATSHSVEQTALATGGTHRRLKRDAPPLYNQNYLPPPAYQRPYYPPLYSPAASVAAYGAYEPPCVGLPIEVHIKSRVKPENVFPIRGNSRIQKCLSLKAPPLNLPPHTNIRLNFKPTPPPYIRPKNYY